MSMAKKPAVSGAKPDAGGATLMSIQAALRAASRDRVRAATQKFAPTAQRVYGVRVPDLNALVTACRPGGFALAEALWNSGAFEERLLAAKLLGAVCRSDPARALRFVAAVSTELSDWAVCDTLGTQGVRAIAQTQREAVFALAEQLIRSKTMWSRRLGIVLLLNFATDRRAHGPIRRLIAPLEKDPEPYIRKAMTWIEKDLARPIR
jgi:3-methyladenine DNA glycosylase AlkD